MDLQIQGLRCQCVLKIAVAVFAVGTAAQALS